AVQSGLDIPEIKMSVELDVFVGNTTIMDEEVYRLWLDGHTGMSGVLNRLCLF
ncbi:hypothetical protein AMECASPLE_037435, partial [Ameca splendens]